MAANNTYPISVTYSDEKLRVFVEEYLVMQKAEFSFRSVCSYILYRAMEENKTSNTGLYESDQLAIADCERVNSVLERIVAERRLETRGYGFVKTMN